MYPESQIKLILWQICSDIVDWLQWYSPFSIWNRKKKFLTIPCLSASKNNTGNRNQI